MSQEDGEDRMVNEESINDLITRRERGLEQSRTEQAINRQKAEQAGISAMKFKQQRSEMSELKKTIQKKIIPKSKARRSKESLTFRRLGRFQKKRLEAIVGKPTTSAQSLKQFQTYRLKNIQRTRINLEKAQQLKALRLNKLGGSRRMPFEPRGFGR